MSKIYTAINNLAQYLRNKLSDDKYYLQYKSTTAPDEFATAVPEIYCFTMPSSALVDGYPARCPCICITLDGRDNFTYDVTLHLCISNVSLNDREMAYPNDKLPNLYTLGENDDYSTEGDSDLIAESILFTDQINQYLENYTAADIHSITVEYVDADLADYPYAISTIMFKMNVNIAKIGERPFDNLY